MSFLYSLAYMNLAQILIISMFLSGIFYFTGYDKGDSQKAEISNVESQIQELGDTIQEKNKELKNMKQFKESVQSGGSKSVQHFLKYIPNTLTTAEIFTHLTKEAKVAGVDILDKRDEGISKSENFYEILKIRIKCTGTFSQITSFLSQLTNQDFILTTDDVSMTNSRESGRSVDIGMNVYGYRYVEKSQEEEKEEDKKEKEEKG